MIQTIFRLAYQYYEFYFYLIAGSAASYAVYFFSKRKLFPVKEKTFILVGSFVLDSAVAIVLRRYLRELNGMVHPGFSAVLLKVLISMLFGAMIMMLLAYIPAIAKKLMYTRFVDTYKYGLIIFAVTAAHLITNAPGEIRDWVAVWYATDYSMGMGSRFFIGTVLRLFYDDYLDKQVAYNFCMVTLIIIILVVSYLLNWAIVRSEESCRKAVAFLALCFVASPGYISSMWTAENMGRLEAFCLLYSAVAVVIFQKVKNNYLRYVIVTVLSCLSVATYQGGLFMYYPIILMLIVYDCLKEDDDCLQKRLLGLGSTVITGIAFLGFQFFSYTIYNDCYEMADALAGKTNLFIEAEAIDLELFKPLTTIYYQFRDRYVPGTLREGAFLALLLLLPIAFCMTAVYIKCHEYRKRAKMQILRSPYIYFIVFNFAVTPQFFLNIDWGRWMTAFNILLFFGVLYLAYQRDKGMSEALYALSAFVERNEFLCGAVVLYLAAMTKFTMVAYTSESFNLGNFLKIF